MLHRTCTKVIIEDLGRESLSSQFFFFSNFSKVYKRGVEHFPATYMLQIMLSTALRLHMFIMAGSGSVGCGQVRCKRRVVMENFPVT